MQTVRFWLRDRRDARPLSEIMKEPSCELVDWMEVPRGYVFPTPGLHDTTAASTLFPRDMRDVQYVLPEIQQVLTKTPLFSEKVKNKVIAHVEILVDGKWTVLVSEIMASDATVATEPKAEALQPNVAQIWRALWPWLVALIVLICAMLYKVGGWVSG